MIQQLLIGGILMMMLGMCNAGDASKWKPAGDLLKTRWAADVDPAAPLPEYPRPQLVRSEWQSLNGLWEYAIRERSAAASATTDTKSSSAQPGVGSWDGRILVPFCVESSLSGVQKPVKSNQELWYRRSFKVDPKWAGKRVRLNFEAVDWQTTVWVNGKRMGEHKGGYDSFSFDITDSLNRAGNNELIVQVWDPTNDGKQAYGKQSLSPHGIFYTAVTGIWQPVWIEPVPEHFVRGLKITPNLDQGTVTVIADVANGKGTTVNVEVLDHDSSPIAKGTGKAGEPITIKIPNVKTWSPKSPHLYNLAVHLSDSEGVKSYFGMRKIEMREDGDGIKRLFLNNKPLFQFGPLDQGWWPDGLYTAPTDEALKSDIQWAKDSGFNMIRKHVKVESRRWYHWCDKLGILVWQDMPNGIHNSINWDRNIDKKGPESNLPDSVKQQFRTELKAMIDGVYNSPSVVVWVPFNERWGQHDTPQTTAWLKKYDPTRPVNSASGGNYHQVGDILDVHSYPNPSFPRLDEKQAVVCGEFGGLGWPVDKHLWWTNKKNWGYRTYHSQQELQKHYKATIDRLVPMIPKGLAAAVYTQTSDVEGEVNGLLTYDRAIQKLDPQWMKNLHQKLYAKHEISFRPPAIPLITIDPFTSSWSMSDKLYDQFPQHWTKTIHAMTGLIRIDGKTKRFMGNPSGIDDLIEQEKVDVHATQTIYSFSDDQVRQKVIFTSPLLMDDLDLMSRPVSYIDFEVVALDGKKHDVQIYFDATAEWAVNKVSEKVNWNRVEVAGQTAMRVGTVAQPALQSKGDNHRVNWGYLLVSAAKKQAQSFMGDVVSQRSQFNKTGTLTSKDEPSVARAASDRWPGLCLRYDLGAVGETTAKRHVLIGYDDIDPIMYFEKKLKSWWRRDGMTVETMLERAETDHESIMKRCRSFDRKLRKDAEAAGGSKYADLCELVYRQAIAAHKLVASPDGKPLFFSKENNSNGSIGTVDVTYPSTPLFFIYNPELVKGMMEPIFYYSESGKWTKPIAAHDVGTYPIANGQTYPKDMPVEECGNMLILSYALARIEGNADYAKGHWKCLTDWAAFLEKEGYDPGNQLCTDDFAGHLAHNCNLSIKAILGLASYGKLAGLQGDKATEKRYVDMARKMATRWEAEAKDGDHYRLTFDREGTWSQKYNLVWDQMLGLNLFSAEVARKEVAYYIKHQNRYGIPLDSRKTFTKSDWIMWSATLAESDEDFRKLTDPIWRYVTMCDQRLPVGDWHESKTAHLIIFAARSVVGGYYMKMLEDKMAESE